MRKFAIGLIATMALALGTVASAADVASVDAYTGFDNSTYFTESNSGINEYKTVLIKNSSSEIVYIDEAETTFGTAVNFMLKGDVSLADGDYTATFGSNSKESKQVTFKVGSRTVTDGDGGSHSATVNTANKMKVADEPEIQEEGSTLYKKGFVFIAETGKLNKVHLVGEDGTTYRGSITIDIPSNISGESAIAYGIQIFNIPEADKGINLYLDTTSNGGASE